MLVTSFTCTCGNDVPKEYMRQVADSMGSKFWFWICIACGQEYREKAKYPITINEEPGYGERKD